MIRYTIMKEIDHRVYFNTEHDDIYHVLSNAKESRIFKDRIACFIFFSTLGYSLRKKLEVENRESRNQIRLQGINESQLASLYTIMLEGKFNSTIAAELLEDGFFKTKLKEVEQYAEGGIQTLIQDVFRHRYFNGRLDDSYPYYEIDILEYLQEISR